MFPQLLHARTGLSAVMRSGQGCAQPGDWTLPLPCSSACGWDGTVGTKWLSLGDITDLPPSEQQGDTVSVPQ